MSSVNFTVVVVILPSGQLQSMLHVWLDITIKDQVCTQVHVYLLETGILKHIPKPLHVHAFNAQMNLFSNAHNQWLCLGYVF